MKRDGRPMHLHRTYEDERCLFSSLRILKAAAQPIIRKGHKCYEYSMVSIDIFGLAVGFFFRNYTLVTKVPFLELLSKCLSFVWPVACSPLPIECVSLGRDINYRTVRVF